MDYQDKENMIDSDKVIPVTDFEESREFKEFLLRENLWQELKIHTLYVTIL